MVAWSSEAVEMGRNKWLQHMLWRYKKKKKPGCSDLLDVRGEWRCK